MVLDLQAEQHEAGQPYQDLYEAVVDLKRRHDLHPCAVRPRDGLALRRDGERELVQDLVKRFRDLPPEQRRRLPALLNSLAQLEVVIGDMDAGLHDFQEVARLVSDPVARAEAHHNVYRAALERRDYDEALKALRRAAALDGPAFEPFPLSRYEPLRILGAGGFGVTFLCEDRQGKGRVAVKALRADSLDRDADNVFSELRALADLDHPTLARVLDCSQPDNEGARPYLVQEYFEAPTLAEHVARNGPLSPEDWFEVCWPLARALQAAHGRGVLHRSLRPAAVLLRRESGDGAQRWRVKLLDTGLSLKRSLIHASASHPAARSQTALGRSVARSIPFLPSEVVGRPKGQVWIGPHSDIYSFGKLCAFALTGRADPDGGDMVLIPEPWQQLLSDCTAWVFRNRPDNMGSVLERLSQLPGAAEAIGRIERGMNEAALAEYSAAIEAHPELADAWIDRGGAYARQGDFALAAADYGRALALRADDAALYRRRAIAHWRSGEVDAAVADFTEALRREPRNLEALANRGLVHAQKNDHDAAIADFTEALKVQPRDDALWYNRGNAHFCKGDHARAIADYTEAVRLAPRHAWAFGNRGKAHALRGDHGRAVADFTRVLQLDPANLHALCDRAASYTELGQRDRALADFSEAIRLEPSAPLYLDRGLIHVGLGDFEQAEADFTEAIALAADFAPAYLLRGNARCDRDDLDGALADFAEVLRLEPNNATAWYNRGNVHARRENFDEALADYGKALEIDANLAAAYFNRGNAQAARGAWDEAVSDYTQALRLAPDDAAAYTNRGNAFGSLDDQGRALADYNRALELEPDDPLTLCNRANTHARLGNEDRALADYTEALRLDPANARIYNARGNVHADRGELDQAIADFTRAIELDASDSGPYYNRGNAHAERGGTAAAITDYTEVLKLEAGHAGALNNRGNAHRRLGEIDKALADFTAAIAADAEFPLPYCNRASLRCLRGDFAGALEDYTAALRLNPTDLATYHSRGRVHAALGNYEQAIADNLEALKLRPGEPRTCNNLAWLWATCPRPELRDAPRALETIRAACAAVGEEDAGYLDTLAAAHAACGQFEEAVRWQRRAMELAPEQERPDYEPRLRLYEAGQRYVELPPAPSSEPPPSAA
jgi:tetratricopeptide (TPR) repeat protein